MWSVPDGAWELDLRQYGRYWVWILLRDGKILEAGTTTNRQRAINKASKAQLRHAKKGRS